VIHWAQSHDEEVRKIAKNAQRFAQENLVFEKIYQYLFLLLTEMGKRQNSST